MGEKTLQTIVEECLVDDCKFNDRENKKCKFDAIMLDGKGNCRSYVRDMEYLRNKWKHEC